MNLLKNKKFIILTIIILIIVGFIVFIIAHRKQVEVLVQHEEISTNEITESTKKLVGIGSLTIEKIELYDAPIQEGTDLNILENYIGHFTNSSIFNGNIAFCSHNRGVENGSYFARLNELQINDKISYKNKIGISQYTVSEIKTIEETDLSIIEPTADDRLTLITCIANDKPHRLCVIASKTN